jgi:rare lipoprotein A
MRAAIIVLLLSSMAGCSFLSGGGSTDGPGADPPPNLERVPDAVPRSESLHPYANRPYTVLGQQYVPTPGVRTYRERGMASWYGRKFHGQPTSSGERYDMYAMTGAHPTLPIPSYVRVTNLRNGRNVVVRINDRGPFSNKRLIDLSYTAAYKLGYVATGTADVEVELVMAGSPPVFGPGRSVMGLAAELAVLSLPDADQSVALSLAGEVSLAGQVSLSERGSSDGLSGDVSALASSSVADAPSRSATARR